jgi:AcrR family transcriptional regulator
MIKRAKRRTILRPNQRRQQLLEAATWVFARKGYRHANVSDIIARAGVARGTFYLYFEGKERIFLTIVDEFHDRMRRAFEALDAAAAAARVDGPRAVLHASFRRWLEFFAAHRDVTRVILREASSIDPRFEQGFLELRESALTRFAGRFRKLQELGLASASLDPDLAAHFQLGMFDELLNWFVLRDDHADLDTLAGQLADFEWNGIRPDRND